MNQNNITTFLKDHWLTASCLFGMAACGTYLSESFQCVEGVRVEAHTAFMNGDKSAISKIDQCYSPSVLKNVFQ